MKQEPGGVRESLAPGDQAASVALLGRCAQLAADLGTFAAISCAGLEHHRLCEVFGEAVAAALRPCEGAAAALYLGPAGGRLTLRRVAASAENRAVPEPGADDDELLLSALAGSAQITVLPGTAGQGPAATSLLASWAATAAVVVPLVFRGQRHGALLLVAAPHAETMSAWQALAQRTGQRVAEVLALVTAHAERQEAELRAKQHAALLSALLENAPDIVMHVELDGRIGFVNRLQYGLRPEDVIGSDWTTFVAGEERVRLRAAFTEALATGRATGVEVAGLGDHGERTLYWSRIAPVRRDGAIVGAVVIARDLTEKRQTEAQLVLSDRMATVGTLAAGVAHEINNPLASVMANLELAQRDVVELFAQHPSPLVEGLVEEVRDARGSAERVRLIVRDLKTLSRADADTLEPVDVEHVLESTLRMARNELRPRARVVRRFERVPLVRGNESRLGQVFLNLIVNAAQAIPEGDAEAHEVRVATSLGADGRVVVTVGDTGPGIPAEVRDRLFTPFFTTKPTGVGTGLGLSICHRIVTALGGEIGFTSEVGRGTEFRVVLPAAAPDTTLPAQAMAPALPAARRRGRILVVDDEDANLRAVQRILAREHDVIAVTSGAEAIARIAVTPSFDVILCDLMMPQMTGMDLHTVLRASHPQLAERMVFVTGGAFTPRAREFLDAIDQQRLEKPFEIQGLRALVNGMVR